MVNFNPNIYYSDKASEAKERYQEAKKETERFKNPRNQGVSRFQSGEELVNSVGK